MSTDALECMEVFLVAYTFPILIWKFLPKLGQTGNSAVYPFFVIEKNVTEVRLIFYVLK
jgi:hypothetical protein